MAQVQSQSQQIAGSLSASELGIENTNIETGPGVELSADQKVLVGSVLDVSTSKVNLYPRLLTKSSSSQDGHH
jgi:hypothetical protein